MAVADIKGVAVVSTNSFEAAIHHAAALNNAHTDYLLAAIALK
ncbi:MAG: hypothetical protein AAGA67_01180 [Cyanobacteria bacterium P01_F01_bin.153]